jgi:hypothetical protein
MGEFTNPLTLTTPHARGQRVKDAQWLLSGHNVFADKKNPIHTYNGDIDGEYGQKSYAATKTAKFWLGYATPAIDGRFGQSIYGLLHGDILLSDENKARRSERLKAAEQPLKEDALEYASGQIGTKESPAGSNLQKYGAWYGMNGVPWCAIFVSYCLSQAHYKKPNGELWKYSYVPTIYNDALNGRYGMSLTHSPQPGDLVCYTFNGTPNAHVAFFDAWADKVNRYFFDDLGGNTGPVDMSNGGEVLRQRRNMSFVTGFVHLP